MKTKAGDQGGAVHDQADPSGLACGIENGLQGSGVIGSAAGDYITVQVGNGTGVYGLNVCHVGVLSFSEMK